MFCKILRNLEALFAGQRRMNFFWDFTKHSHKLECFRFYYDFSQHKLDSKFERRINFCRRKVSQVGELVRNNVGGKQLVELADMTIMTFETSKMLKINI